MATAKDDVYLVASKHSMGIFKISLHKSGVWTLVVTARSGETFAYGDGRDKRWYRPREHAPGITRGPSICIPHTSLGPRRVSTQTKGVIWYPAPSDLETIEFSLYFVANGSRTAWGQDQTVLAEQTMRRGNRVALLAETKPTPTGFLDTVERLLLECGLSAHNGATIRDDSFLWITHGTDWSSVPLIVDLPIPFT